jgi:predicted DNA-binding transcriptional regulator YafY
MKIERSTEIVRQWQILMAIESAADATIPSLSEKLGVTTRTIRRDLTALQQAGFPIYDDRVDGQVYWRLSGRPFKRLTDTAFTLTELCAFYVNRARLASIGASPIEADVQSALAKISSALSPAMRTFLDDLGIVVNWKPDPGPRAASRGQKALVDDLVRATMNHRRVEMRYHSFSGQQVKEYSVEPYRLTFGNGGLYLSAYVPAYGQMRTFATQRIRTLRVLDDTFSPVQQLPAEVFGTSLGIFTGPPEHVEILFEPPVAAYVEERQWHRSQTVTRHEDGTITLALEVSNDLALRSWVLSFGHAARVLTPEALASDILDELQEASGHYGPQMPLELSEAVVDHSRQYRLPFPSAEPARAERASRPRTSRAAGSSRRVRPASR